MIFMTATTATTYLETEIHRSSLGPPPKKKDAQGNNSNQVVYPHISLFFLFGTTTCR